MQQLNLLMFVATINSLIASPPIAQKNWELFYTDPNGGKHYIDRASDKDSLSDESITYNIRSDFQAAQSSPYNFIERAYTANCIDRSILLGSGLIKYKDGREDKVFSRFEFSIVQPITIGAAILKAACPSYPVKGPPNFQAANTKNIFKSQDGFNFSYDTKSVVRSTKDAPVEVTVLYDYSRIKESKYSSIVRQALVFCGSRKIILGRARALLREWRQEMLQAERTPSTPTLAGPEDALVREMCAA